MSRGNLLRLGLLALIWGASFLLIKFALVGLSPMQIVLGRLLGAAVALLGILAVRRLALPREPSLWGHLILMGVLASIVPFWLFAFAGQRISSGLSGVLNGTTPLFTLLFAVLVARLAGLDERLGRMRVAGLVLGFLGTVVVLAPWRPGAVSGTVAGQLACVAASACYGAGFVYARRFVSPSGYPPIVLAAVQLVSATLLGSLAAPFVASGPMSLSAGVVASITVLGVVGTGLAYLLYYRLVADAGATTASTVTYLIPVIAVALGVVALSEPLSWNLFAGGAIVIAGVALAEGRVGGWIGGRAGFRATAAEPPSAPPAGATATAETIRSRR